MLTTNDDRADLPLPGERLYARLAEHFRRVIASGALMPGDRMPSVRAVMQQHRVSLSTALQTLRQLEDAGWLAARPRAGYFVQHPRGSRLESVREPAIESLDLSAQYVGLHERVSRVLWQAREYPDALNLGGATADASLYPGEQLQAITGRTLRRRPTLLTEPGADGGVPEFRQVIARRALSAGISVSPEHVIVASGGVEAVNLALRAVAQPGDTIAIESPAFFGLLQILESLGLRALEIPASPSTGLSLEALEVALNSGAPIKALVVVPNLQNPLGCIMPDARKAALVELCNRHGIALIEDDPYRELAERAEGVKPLKAWDHTGNVIYCATLNKVLAPGMRLGWMCAGRWYARVQMLKYSQTRHTETLSQLVAAEFIGSGAFDRHLHRMRERLRVQREAVADAIARHFPPGTQLSPPDGGLLLWVALPQGVHAGRVFETALQAGVRVAPGTIFSNSNRFDRFIRLGCPRPFDRALDQALRRLGEVVAGAAPGPA